MVLRLSAEPSSVPDSRAAVTRWCDGVAAGRPADIALAVTEAAANVVRHAYPAGGGEFEVRADVRDGELFVAVRDWGVGIQAPSPNAGLGVGLLIIQQVADWAVVEDCAPGTLVCMRFSTSREVV
jgi:anti-sigma regulatory factor (Ser/Thr protein kinase)